MTIRLPHLKQRLDCGNPPKPVPIRGVTYPSMGEAARQIGVNVSTISRAHREGWLQNVGIVKKNKASQP
jgi:hypothetical protein